MNAITDWTVLETWLMANATGYWVSRDGSISYALYRPHWLERLLMRIVDGDKWVPFER
jgi:hypothetical protein